MNGYDLKLRNLVSTWFSLFFLILLAFYLGYIEFFLNTQSKFEEKNPFERLIREDILENINTLKFKNRIGSFTIQKENNAWILKQPRKVPANSKTIQKIIKELQNIKVQTIHQNEPINYQSFSLDK
ncbi:MAG: hypothetical protein HON90_03645, partial [Halobacteriovoraceae bacterium]|nr:hypothetical protein [Halobacteriovoraceae bacterium]